jgi:autotransporter passenger strand-loop-strand repeat protein
VARLNCKERTWIMTMYSAPPNQNGLVLGNGDVLQVNTGGTATNTVVEGSGEVVVAGGTAVNTILQGAQEIVHGGIARGVTFDGGDAVLSAADPAFIQGTLIF